MSGDAGHERLIIPVASMRVYHDDTERTRLLKDVLRSSHAMQENEGGAKQPRKMVLSMDHPMIRGPKKDRTKRKSGLGPDLAELEASQEEDNLCATVANVEELSPLLRHCGSRIGSLCATLQASEEQFQGVAGFSRPGSRALQASGAKVDNGIRIADRPEDSAGVMRARTDRVVFDFIAKHARFDKLEEFKDSIDRCEGYEDLRGLIPRRHQGHPGLALLDDSVLTDPAKLRDVIWNRNTASKGYATGGLGSSGGLGASGTLRATQRQRGLAPERLPATLRSGSSQFRGGATMGANNLGRTLRLDRSAPALL